MKGFGTSEGIHLYGMINDQVYGKQRIDTPGIDTKGAGGIAPEGLYFASEVKTLAALAGRGFAPNLDQLRRYMVHGYKSLYKQRTTFFTDIEELPPGHVTAISANVIAQRASSVTL